MVLDLPTLLFVAVLIATLLGAFMILAWLQDKTLRALAWWGAAYLIAGSAGSMWGARAPLAMVPAGYSSALIFVACGMVWNGVRLFQGRRVLPLAVVAGALLWLIAMQAPDLANSENARAALAALVVSGYIFCITFEMWRERRKTNYSRLTAIVVPLLHAAIFVVPVAVSTLVPAAPIDWIGLFAIEVMLYAVGAAFLVVLMVKDRNVLMYRTAASTDHLTGLLNRRAFGDSATALCLNQRRHRAPITVFVFDLDHFKSINDRFGHATGDDALRVFAECVRTSMRAGDIIGRLGGEEFAAVVPASSAVASEIAERVRVCFERAGAMVGTHALAATVSVGAASAEAADLDIDALVGRADAALYRAKNGGRNRVEFAEDVPCDAARTSDAERNLNRRAGLLFRAFLRRSAP